MSIAALVTRHSRHLSLALRAGIVLVGALTTAAVQGQTVPWVQTTTFSFSGGGTLTGTGEVIYLDSLPDDFFTATFQPFNSALGDLKTISINWAITVSGTNTGALSRSLSLGGDATHKLGTYSYNGWGGGNSGSSGAVSFMATADRNWTVATFNDNPAILALFTGTVPFTASVGSDVYSQFGGLALGDTADYTVAVTGGVSLTYNYVAAAVPEPATYGVMAGLTCMGAAAWVRRRSRQAAANAV